MFNNFKENLSFLLFLFPLFILFINVSNCCDIKNHVSEYVFKIYKTAELTDYYIKIMFEKLSDGKLYDLGKSVDNKGRSIDIGCYKFLNKNKENLLLRLISKKTKKISYSEYICNLVKKLYPGEKIAQESMAEYCRNHFSENEYENKLVLVKLEKICTNKILSCV
jgi:hypothetical protein